MLVWKSLIAQLLMVRPLLAEEDSSGIGSILFWGVVFIVLIVAGVFVVTFIRKRFRDDVDLGTPGGGGFTLPTLRELLKEGKLTQEEFDKAKQAIIEAAQASAKRKEEENAAGKAKGFPVRPPKDGF